MTGYPFRSGRALALLILVSCTPFSRGVTYYVANDGSDLNTGLSSALPFKTFAAFSPSTSILRSGDTIALRKGHVFRGQLDLNVTGTLNITAWGGVPSTPPPVISGSLLVPASAVWQRVPPGGPVWALDVQAAFGTSLTFRSVFFNGRRMLPARWPNYNWAQRSAVFATCSSFNASTNVFLSSFFGANQTNAGRFVGGTVVFRNGDTTFQTSLVQAYAHSSGVGALTTADSVAVQSRWTGGFGFFVQNVAAELDEPGEWHYDPVTHLLSIRPFGDALPAVSQVELAVYSHGLNLASNPNSALRVAGVRFERQAGFGINFGANRNASVTNCTFVNQENGGLFATSLSQGVIANNVFEDIAGLGVSIAAGSGTQLVGNRFSRIGLEAQSSSSGQPNYGVFLGSTTQTFTLSANAFDAIGHTPLQFGGANHTVASNRIADGLLFTNAAGCLVTSGSSSNGHTIAHNVVRDCYGNVVSTPSATATAYGILLDARARDSRLQNNTVSGTSGSALRLAGASNVLVAGCSFSDVAVSTSPVVQLVESSSQTPRGVSITACSISSVITDQPLMSITTTNNFTFGSTGGNFYCSPGVWPFSFGSQVQTFGQWQANLAAAGVPDATSVFCNATAPPVYYVALNGSDSKSGLSPADAWQTIDKVNANMSAIIPGSTILFRNGDVFRGQQLDLSIATPPGTIRRTSYVSSWGNASLPPPVISGSLRVPSNAVWRRSGSSFVYSTVLTGLLGTRYANASVQNVFLAGQRLTQARWPTGGSLNAFKNCTLFNATTNTIYSTDGFFQPSGYFNGGMAVVRVTDSLYQSSVISAYTLSAGVAALTLADPISPQWSSGFGFYVRNVFAELDTAGEWFYNPSTRNLTIRASGASPPTNNTVDVSVVPYGVTVASGQSQLVISGLRIEQQAADGLFLAGPVQNLTVSGCSFAQQEYRGINAAAALTSSAIINNDLRDIAGQGISLASCSSTLLAGNELTDIGTLDGLGLSNVPYNGITISAGSGCSLVNNTLERIGAHGLAVLNANTGAQLIDSNRISQAALTVNAAHGIYSTSRNGHTITRNTIRDVWGNLRSAGGPRLSVSHGVYLTGMPVAPTVASNVVSGVGSVALWLVSPQNATVVGNVLANASSGDTLVVTDSGGANPSRGLLVANNTLSSLVPTLQLVQLPSTPGQSLSFANNSYCSPAANPFQFGSLFVPFASWLSLANETGSAFCSANFYTPTFHYVASNGSDSNTGLSPAQAWQTLQKVNAEMPSMAQGDHVLLRRGDVFRGQLTLTFAPLLGASYAPLTTVGAFGDPSRPRPVVSGSVVVSSAGWQRYNGGPIYVASLATLTAPVVNVFWNGRRLPLARWPNVDASSGAATFAVANASGLNYVVSDQFPPVAPTHYNGGLLVVRASDSFYQAAAIAPNGNNFALGATLYAAVNFNPSVSSGFGFYVEGVLAELDQPGEWFFNADTKLLYLWPPGGVSPTQGVVEASVRSFGLMVPDGTDLVVLSDLAFEQQAADGVVFAGNSRNVSLSNCSFAHQELRGVNVQGTLSAAVLQDNSFANITGHALFINAASTVTVAGSRFDSIGLADGQGLTGVPLRAVSVSSGGSANVRIADNTFSNLGCTAVFVSGSNLVVAGNAVDGALLTVSNEAAVRVASRAGPSLVVDNVLRGVYGSVVSSPNAAQGFGILLDTQAHDAVVSNNTVGGSVQTNAVRLNSVVNVSLAANTLSGAAAGPVLAVRDAPAQPTVGLAVVGNRLNSTLLTTPLLTLSGSAGSSVTFSSNAYCSLSQTPFQLGGVSMPYATWAASVPDVAAALCNDTVPSTTYYLAADGSDTNSGTSPADPFRSLARLNAMMAQFRSGDSVLFRRGDVFRGQLTLNFPVTVGVWVNTVCTLSSYGDPARPPAVISGALAAPPGLWQLHAGGVYKLNLTAAFAAGGYTSPAVTAVYYNDQRLTLARFPNNQLQPNTSAFVVPSAPVDSAGLVIRAAALTQPTGRFNGATMRYRNNDWTYAAARVASYTLSGGVGELTLATSIYGTELGFSFGNSPPQWGFFLENVLAELDMPGEWFHDTGAGILYIWPPSGGSPAAAQVELSLFTHGLLLSSPDTLTQYVVSDLRFEKQAVAGVEKTNIDASAGFRNVTIDRCYFRHQEQSGVVLGSFVSNSTISNCVFENITSRGIFVGDMCWYNRIVNNNLTDIGRWEGQGVQGDANAIRLIGGYNCTLQGNIISRVGYCGINWSGRSNRVDGNVVSWPMMALNDGAAFYSGGRTSVNQIVTNNVARDSYGNWASAPFKNSRACGFYFDVGSAGHFVFNNTASGVGQNALKIAGGSRNLTVVGNTFYHAYGNPLAFTNSTPDELPTGSVFVCNNISAGPAMPELMPLFTLIAGMSGDSAKFVNNAYCHPRPRQMWYWSGWSCTQGAGCLRGYSQWQTVVDDTGGFLCNYSLPDPPGLPPQSCNYGPYRWGLYAPTTGTTASSLTTSRRLTSSTGTTSTGTTSTGTTSTGTTSTGTTRPLTTRGTTSTGTTSTGTSSTGTTSTGTTRPLTTRGTTSTGTTSTGTSSTGTTSTGTTRPLTTRGTTSTGTSSTGTTSTGTSSTGTTSTGTTRPLTTRGTTSTGTTSTGTTTTGTTSTGTTSTGTSSTGTTSTGTTRPLTTRDTTSTGTTSTGTSSTGTTSTGTTSTGTTRPLTTRGTTSTGTTSTGTTSTGSTRFLTTRGTTSTGTTSSGTTPSGSTSTGTSSTGTTSTATTSTGTTSSGTTVIGSTTSSNNIPSTGTTATTADADTSSNTAPTSGGLSSAAGSTTAASASGTDTTVTPLSTAGLQAAASSGDATTTSGIISSVPPSTGGVDPAAVSSGGAESTGAATWHQYSSSSSSSSSSPDGDSGSGTGSVASTGPSTAAGATSTGTAPADTSAAATAATAADGLSSTTAAAHSSSASAADLLTASIASSGVAAGSTTDSTNTTALAVPPITSFATTGGIGTGREPATASVSVSTTGSGTGHAASSTTGSSDLTTASPTGAFVVGSTAGLKWTSAELSPTLGSTGTTSTDLAVFSTAGGSSLLSSASAGDPVTTMLSTLPSDTGGDWSAAATGSTAASETDSAPVLSSSALRTTLPLADSGSSSAYGDGPSGVGTWSTGAEASASGGRLTGDSTGDISAPSTGAPLGAATGAVTWMAASSAAIISGSEAATTAAAADTTSPSDVTTSSGFASTSYGTDSTSGAGGGGGETLSTAAVPLATAAVPASTGGSAGGSESGGSSTSEDAAVARSTAGTPPTTIEPATTAADSHSGGTTTTTLLEASSAAFVATASTTAATTATDHPAATTAAAASTTSTSSGSSRSDGDGAPAVDLRDGGSADAQGGGGPEPMTLALAAGGGGVALAAAAVAGLVFWLVRRRRAAARQRPYAEYSKGQTAAAKLNPLYSDRSGERPLSLPVDDFAQRRPRSAASIGAPVSPVVVAAAAAPSSSAGVPVRSAASIVPVRAPPPPPPPAAAAAASRAPPPPVPVRPPTAASGVANIALRQQQQAPPVPARPQLAYWGDDTNTIYGI